MSNLLWESRARDVDARRLDPALRLSLRELLDRGFGGEHEEGSTVFAAEHARHGTPARHGDAGGDLAAFPDADEFVLAEARRPHGTFGVEADTVGLPIAEVREEAPTGERPVALQVERGERSREGLRDDQRLAVGRDDRAVRKREVLRDDPRLSCRFDRDEAGRSRLGAGEEIETEV